jgi:tetratricopeptide (TPR) repeat protein
VTVLRHYRLHLLAAVAVIGTAIAVTPNTAAAIPMDNPNPAPAAQQPSAAPAAKQSTTTKIKNFFKRKARSKDKKQPVVQTQKSSSAADFLTGYRQAYALVYTQHDYAGGIAKLRSLDRDDHSDVATMIGFASRKLGRYDDAKTWYDKALAADPDNARTLSYYGMWHAEQGNKLKATDFLDKVASVCGNTTCREYAELKAVIGGARIY